MTSLPLLCRWTGNSFEPVRKSDKASADRDFVIGETYRLAEIEDRSSKSHAHYFASLTDAWRSLPDDQAERFPTMDHMRKFALIKTGFADSRQFVASSKAEAVRLAAFLRPVDEYAVVSVEQCVVMIWTAQSQSTRAMGKQKFQESKTAVLEYVAGLLGCTTDELRAA
jgi:hypothetical protein